MSETLERRLVVALKARGRTLAAAESCTGGLAAKRLTDVPGASAVFLGGVVSYTNGVKERVLHVPHETLETYSAVSEQTARAMAEGVRRLTGADFGLSVTGVAGPDRDDRGMRWVPYTLPCPQKTKPTCSFCTSPAAVRPSAPPPPTRCSGCCWRIFK